MFGQIKRLLLLEGEAAGRNGNTPSLRVRRSLVEAPIALW